MSSEERQQQIPCGDDRQKSKGNSNSKYKDQYRGLSTAHRKMRDASVEMTVGSGVGSWFKNEERWR